MRDRIVVENCRRAGIDVCNIQAMLPYESVECKPRILDKAPRRLDKFKYEEAYAYGCCNEIIMTFMKAKEEYPKDAPQYGVLEFGGGEKRCHLDLYFFLKSLVLSSLGVVQERAEASFEIFSKLLTAPCDLTDMETVRTFLTCDSSQYYQCEIIKAAKVCLFGENPVVQFWETKAEFIGYYPEAMTVGRQVIEENCKEIKDVNRFINKYAKEAREDTEFMKSLYKKGVNKYLYAIIYYARNEHPEVLNMGQSGDGFAPIS